MKSKWKADISVCVAFVLMAVALFFFFNGHEGKNVVITVNGELFGEYRLDIDRVIDINGSNIVSIKDGKVSMIYSDCGGHDCEREGGIFREGSVIACLPNGVLVRIKGDIVDAVA